MLVESRAAGTPRRSRDRRSRASKPGIGTPSEPGGVSGDLRHVDAALGRAVAVDDEAAEALPRSGRCRAARPRCRTRSSAGCRRRRVVGRGEDVRERLADVVEERDAVACGRRAASRSPRTGAAARRSRRPRRRSVNPATAALEWNSGIDRVADVVRSRAGSSSASVVAPAAQPALAHRHGLRRAGRARREDEHERVRGRRSRRRAAPRRRTARARRPTRGSSTTKNRVGRARRRRHHRAARGASARSAGARSRCAAMSRASSAPRRVGLMPTSVAPRQRGTRRARTRTPARCRAARRRGRARRPACARAGTRPVARRVEHSAYVHDASSKRSATRVVPDVGAERGRRSWSERSSRAVWHATGPAATSCRRRPRRRLRRRTHRR